MKKVIKLTERDLNRIVKRVLNEEMTQGNPLEQITSCLQRKDINTSLPKECVDLINDAMKTKIPPNPFDTKSIACASKFGMNALTIMPEIMSCLKSAVESPIKY